MASNFLVTLSLYLLFDKILILDTGKNDCFLQDHTEPSPIGGGANCIADSTSLTPTTRNWPPLRLRFGFIPPYVLPILPQISWLLPGFSCPNFIHGYFPICRHPVTSKYLKDQPQPSQQQGKCMQAKVGYSLGLSVDVGSNTLLGSLLSTSKARAGHPALKWAWAVVKYN